VLGSGLALCAAIVRAHGGTLDLGAAGASRANFRLYKPDSPTPQP
jgi:signal transduction histidine kinase